MNIDLHIEELVLHGIHPGDRLRVGEALEAELARLISEQGVPPGLIAGGDRDRLDAGAFQASPRAHPESYGAEAARAVYGGLGK
jgi:hypothetical protein